MRVPHRPAAWDWRARRARDATLPAPPAHGRAGRTRRRRARVDRRRSTAGWPARSGAAARPPGPRLRRGTLSFCVGFVAQHRESDTDEPVELLGAGPRQQAFVPGAVAVAKGEEEA